jgi:hypothetical protein
MLNLATVMNSPVSMASRHGLSSTQPCVTRLGSALSMTACGRRALMYMPFLPAPARFLTVGHPSCPPLCCFSITIRTFLVVPACFLEVFHHISGAGHFLPPLRMGSYPGSGLAPHSSSMLIVFGLFAWWGANSSPGCPGARFVRPGC